jgi:hypothetical protein
MRARTTAIVAGIAGGLGWLAKIVVMALQDGPDPDSIPEAVAFFVGLLGVMIAAAATGAFLARERPPVRRVGAAVGAVVATGVVIGIGQWALGSLPGDGWLQEEAIFGLVGLVALAAALFALRARPERTGTLEP